MKQRLAMVIVSLFVFLSGHYAFAEELDIVAFSKQYVGVPYKWGGKTPKGFDCSGFVTYVYQEFGVSLPRTAEEQYRRGKKVSKEELAVGDLVFFTTYKKTASHTGIYIGDDKFIHASDKGVIISDLDESYWRKTYLGARRYFDSDEEVAALQSYNRLGWH
ncbi:cell wall-associated NlpC family hydrolase [Anoxybacillus voinovskiensis]|uniref:Cell wall-associated NlpC family hydrolase n=1 Tax=Anoxybacteroides voinovskiense TaxID=230470 RepID=A0A840DQ48_9BACL|nr:C40 family peptidase [Anoxybacillus voinovskiensis]MBB4073793.1 cell wall-associated NlpC family hydrolase [Anoxybacillus voinovskiensis]GGJ63873.1 hypothetical protein GCM10008982_11370 [Anoxybacillus voinovskiensis]